MPSDFVSSTHRVHTLLRLADPGALIWEERRPDWALPALQLAPWVVVRRVAPRSGLWPVGLRGNRRFERCAAWLPQRAVCDSLTPQQLAAAHAWRRRPAADATPAIIALDAVAEILRAQGFAQCWGPGGSAGYELASGLPCTTPHSDLDLVIEAGEAVPQAQAAALHAALSRLPVRIDALLETPQGAVALAEYAAARGALRLRTPQGSCLVTDPWSAAAATALGA